MTLIFGINLSNRIYLTADTRLSRFSSNNFDRNNPDKVQDDIIKVISLNNDTLVAVAGSIHLARYLVKKLKEENFIKEGINKIRIEIANWVAGQVDNYLSEGNTYASACLLFGGIDRKKNKVVDGNKIIELVKELKAEKNITLGMNDTLFKGISARPNQANPYPELPTPDSKIFAVLTDAKNNSLEIEDCDWGEYVAYGPKGFKKEFIPKSIFGRLEFENGSGIAGSDQPLLTAITHEIAEKHQFTTIGGSIIPMLVDINGVGVICGKVHRLDPRTNTHIIVSDTKLVGGNINYYSSDKKTYLPLISFIDYVSDMGKLYF